MLLLGLGLVEKTVGGRGCDSEDKLQETTAAKGERTNQRAAVRETDVTR